MLTKAGLMKSTILLAGIRAVSTTMSPIGISWSHRFAKYFLWLELFCEPPTIGSEPEDGGKVCNKGVTESLLQIRKRLGLAWICDTDHSFRSRFWISCSGCSFILCWSCYFERGIHNAGFYWSGYGVEQCSFPGRYGWEKELIYMEGGELPLL